MRREPRCVSLPAAGSPYRASRWRRPSAANSSFRGVQLGICSYSFRGMGPAEQTPEQRELVRQWRLTVALDDIRAIRRRLDDAGAEMRRCLSYCQSAL